MSRTISTLIEVYEKLKPPVLDDFLFRQLTNIENTIVCGLMKLPNEVLSILIRYLSARDISIIAVTNTHLHRYTVSVVPGMRLELFTHQIVSLVWMLRRESFKRGDLRGGLICDEPGLGKTITCLALILRTRGTKPSLAALAFPEEKNCAVRGLRSPDSRRREVNPKLLLPSAATLIIVPETLLTHWQHQVLKITSRRASIFGSIFWDFPEKEKMLPDGKKLANYGLVVTTFRRLATEWRYGRPSCALEERQPKRLGYENGQSGTVTSPLLQVYWLRVIVDEGHVLGTLSLSDAKLMANCIVAERRWVMTGTPTPKKNEGSDLRHLMGLFKFLRDPFFNQSDVWNSSIARPMGGSNAPVGANTLLAQLRRVMIRHTKESIALPTPRRLKTLVRLFSHEAETYNTIVSFVRSNLLITEADPINPGALHKDSLLNPCNRKYAAEVINNLQLACSGGGIFDIRVQPESWRQTLESLHKWNCDETTVNLVDDFIRRATTGQHSTCAICATRFKLLLVIPCGHLLCCECFSQISTGVCGKCQKKYDIEDFQKLQPGFDLRWSWEEQVYQPTRSNFDRQHSEISHRNIWEHSFQANNPDSGSVGVLQLTSENRLLASSKANNLLMKLKNIETERLAEWNRRLDAINRRDGNIKEEVHLPIKVIVFTQYSAYLHQLEAFLLAKGVHLAKFHGKARGAALKLFREDPAVSVLLLSKDGSHGLDLSFVTHIFLLDEINDKSIEDQVISRAYRMGCSGPVLIDQIILEGTAEQLMHEISLQRFETLPQLTNDNRPLSLPKGAKLTSKNQIMRRRHANFYKDQAKMHCILQQLQFAKIPDTDPSQFNTFSVTDEAKRGEQLHFTKVCGEDPSQFDTFSVTNKTKGGDDQSQLQDKKDCMNNQGPGLDNRIFEMEIASQNRKKHIDERMQPSIRKPDHYSQESDSADFSVDRYLSPKKRKVVSVKSDDKNTNTCVGCVKCIPAPRNTVWCSYFLNL